MFPIAIRWQVVRNRERCMSCNDTFESTGCIRRAGHEWWEMFRRHASQWNEDAIHSMNADAAWFNVPFLRALDGTVKAHLDIILSEISSIILRLEGFPDWHRSSPLSVSTLGILLRQIS